MEIDNLTLGQIKELKSLFGGGKGYAELLPMEVGKNYFIRTVTLYYTGKLKKITSDAMVLERAAWIADTGRFYEFLKNGEAYEVEPFVDPVIIPLGSVVDVTEWRHALLESQK